LGQTTFRSTKDHSTYFIEIGHEKQPSKSLYKPLQPKMNSSNTNQGFVWGHEICDFHIRGKGWKGIFITGAMTTMTTMTIPMDVEEMVQALLEAQEGDPERPLMVLVEEAPWPHGASRQWWMWIVGAHDLEDPLCKNPW
jgi:hypothetical protein